MPFFIFLGGGNVQDSGANLATLMGKLTETGAENLGKMMAMMDEAGAACFGFALANMSRKELDGLAHTLNTATPAILKTLAMGLASPNYAASLGRAAKGAKWKKVLGWFFVGLGALMLLPLVYRFVRPLEGMPADEARFLLMLNGLLCVVSPVGIGAFVLWRARR